MFEGLSKGGEGMSNLQASRRNPAAVVAAMAVALTAVFATPAARADNLLFQLFSTGNLQVIQSDISSTTFRSLSAGGSCGGFMYFGGTSCIFWNAHQTGSMPFVGPAFSISSSLYNTSRNGIAAPGSDYPVGAFDISPIITEESLSGTPLGPFEPFMTGLDMAFSQGFAPVLTNSCSSGSSFYAYNQFEVPGPGCLPWMDNKVHEFMTLNWYDGTVDHIQFQYVPEPATFALFGSGLLTLCGRVRRRRSRSQPGRSFRADTCGSTRTLARAARDRA